MALRYWIGNDGSWNDTSHWSTTSGGPGGASVPDTQDDAIFDASSFSANSTVYMTENVYVKDWDMSVIDVSVVLNRSAGHIYVHGDVSLNKNLSISGVLNLYIDTSISGVRIYNPAGVRFIGGHNWAPKVTDVSTIVMGDIWGGIIQFGGTGSNNCDLDFNGYNVIGTSQINFYGYGNERFFMGSGTFTSGYHWFASLADTQFFSQTSTIHLTGGTLQLDSGMDFYNVILDRSSGIPITPNNANWTVQNLEITPGTHVTFNDGNTVTINNSFTSIGTTDASITISSSSSIPANLIYNGEGLVTGNYLYIQDSSVSPENTFYAGSNSVDLGGNSNWLFSDASLYWVDDSGNWTDASKWSQTSGGTGGVMVPNELTNVIFDASSFTTGGQTVTLDLDASVLNLDMSSVDQAITFAIGTKLLSCYGSIYMSADVATSGTGDIRLRGSGNHELGIVNSLSADMYWFNGNYTLTNNLILDRYLQSGETSGIFDANDFDIEAGFIYLQGGTPTVYMGSGTWAVTGVVGGGNWAVIIDSQVTLFAEESTLKFAKDVAINDFLLRGNAFNIIHFSNEGSNKIYQGMNASNTFSANQIIIDPGITVEFSAGGTLTVNESFTAIGTADSSITIKGYGDASTNLIYQGTDLVTVDHCNISYTNVTPSNTWYAGTNSVDVSNNTGWTFDYPNVYWVGDSGNISDASKWSKTSGGDLTGPTPTSLINARFDASSFTTPSTVTVDQNFIFRSIDMSTVIYDVTLQQDNSITSYGDFILGPSVNRIGTSSTTYFYGDGSHNLNIYDTSLCILRIYSGFYTLQNDLRIDGDVNGNGMNIESAGGLDANDYNVSWNGRIDLDATIYMGNGMWSAVGDRTYGGWILQAYRGNLDIISEESTIYFNKSGFIGDNGLYVINNHTLNNVIVGGEGIISDYNGYTWACNNFTIEPSAIWRTYGNNNITFNESFNAVGTPTERITIYNNTDGATANLIFGGTGYIACDYLDISDTNVTPSDTWYAGTNSIDVSNNTGWTFDYPTLYWVGDTGNWSDASMWSKSSGGAINGSVPTALTHARFDASSFTTSSVTTIDTSIDCLSLDMSTVIYDVSLVQQDNLYVHGNFVLGSSINRSGDYVIYLQGENSHDINTYNKDLYRLVINGGSNNTVYTLQSDLTVTYSNIYHPAFNMSFEEGFYRIFDANDYNITSYADINFHGTENTLKMGTGTWKFTGTGAYGDFHMNYATVDGSSATIIWDKNNSAGIYRWHNWPNKYVSNIELKGNVNYYYFYYSGTVDSLTIDPSIKLVQNNTYTLTVNSSFNAIGTDGSIITLQGEDGSAYFVFDGSGVIDTIDYVNVSYIEASPENTWYAGANSIDSGNNSGWIFSAVPSAFVEIYRPVLLNGRIVIVNVAGQFQPMNSSQASQRGVSGVTYAELTSNGLSVQMVSNGTFDTVDDWTLGTGWSIIPGEVARYDNSGGAGTLVQSDGSMNVSIETSTTYLMTFDVSCDSGGLPSYFGVYNAAGNYNWVPFTGRATGSYEIEFTTGSDIQGGGIQFNVIPDAAFDLDNVTLRKVITTTVEGDVTAYANLGGDTSLGSEMIVNGNLDTSTNWQLIDFSIENGVATYNNNQSGYIRQLDANMNASIESGKIYLLSFDILSGAIRGLWRNTTNEEVYIDYATYTPNHYEFEFSPTLSNRGISFNTIVGYGAPGTIDNISLKEIIPIDSAIIGYGPEVLRDGDFSDGSLYWVASDASLINSQVEFFGGTGWVRQTGGTMIQDIKPNTDYVAKFDLNVDRQYIRLYDTNGNFPYTDTEDYLAGTNEVFFTTGSLVGGIRFETVVDPTPFILDNFSIREVLKSDVSANITAYANLGGATTLGSELITNGSFSDGSTNWSYQSPTEIVYEDGKIHYLHLISGDAGITQIDGNMQSSMEPDVTYELSFDIFVNNANARFRVQSSSTSNTFISDTNYSNGHHAVQFLSPSNVSGGIRFVIPYSTNTTDWYIDNISLKKVVPEDNSKISTIVGLSDEYLFNSSLTNADGGWVANGGWSWTNNQANYTTRTSDSWFEQTNAQMNIGMSPYTTYRIEFDLSTGSYFDLRIESYSAVTYISRRNYYNGHQLIDFTTGSTVGSGGLAFRAYANTNNAVVDNISIKKHENSVTTGDVAAYANLGGALTYGPQLLTNGTFDTSANWTLGNGWSWIDGRMYYDDIEHEVRLGQTDADMAGSIEPYTTYELRFLLDISTGTARFYVSNYPGNISTYIPLSIYPGAGENVYYFTTESNTDGFSMWAYTNATGPLYLDNVLLRKVTVSQDEVVRTDLGPEMLTNGELTGGTGWDQYGTGMTLINDKAYYDDLTNGGIRQLDGDLAYSFINGAKYRIEFDIDISSGNANLRTETVQGGNFSNRNYSDGHHIIEVTYPADGDGILFYGGTNSDNPYYLDNLSVKRILSSEVSGDVAAYANLGGEPIIGPELLNNTSFVNSEFWDTNGSDWTIENGVASYDGTSSYPSRLSQPDSSMNGSIIASTQYIVSFTLSGISGTSYFGIYNSELNSSYVSGASYSNGNYQIIFTTNIAVGEAGFSIYSDSGGAFNIDNVSLKTYTVNDSILARTDLGNELVTNGDFSDGSTNWVVNTDKVESDQGYLYGQGLSAFDEIAYQNNLDDIVQYGTYLVEFDVSVLTPGGAAVYAFLGGYNNSFAFNTTGRISRETYLQFGTQGLPWIRFANANTPDVSIIIDNVSVKKIAKSLALATLDTYFTPEYQTVYDAMPTTVDSSTAGLQNELVKTLVDASIWTNKFDFFYLFAGNSSDNSYINWVNPGTYDASENGTTRLLTFTPWEGWKGDGTKRIHTGFEPSANGVNWTYTDAGFGLYLRTDIRETNVAVMGNEAGSGDVMLQFESVGTTNYLKFHTGANRPWSGADTSIAGLWSINRISNTSVRVYHDGSLNFSTSLTNEFPSNAEMRILDREGVESENQVAMAFGGSSLTEDENKTLLDAVELYLDSLETGVVPFVPEYQAVYDNFSTSLDTYTADKQNAMVRTLVDNGIWDKMDLFYVFANNSSDNALINWVNPGTFDASSINSPAFVSYEGFTGDGSSSYLNTNYTPSTDASVMSQNSLSLNYYLRTAGNGGIAFGSEVGSDIYCYQNLSTTSLFTRLNAGTNSNFTGSLSKIGTTILTRVGSTESYHYAVDGSAYSSTASNGVPSGAIYICADHNASGLPSNFYTGQFSIFSLGSSMSAEDASIIQNTFETYMDSFGKGVIN